MMQHRNFCWSATSRKYLPGDVKPAARDVGPLEKISRKIHGELPNWPRKRKAPVWSLNYSRFCCRLAAQTETRRNQKVGKANILNTDGIHKDRRRRCFAKRHFTEEHRYFNEISPVAARHVHFPRHSPPRLPVFKNIHWIFRATVGEWY